MKPTLINILRVCALGLAIIALIAAIPDSQHVFGVRWVVWVSAAFVAFFGERLIERL